MVPGSLYIDAIPATSIAGTKGNGLSQKTNISSSLHPNFGIWNDWDVYYPHGGGNPVENYKIFPFQRNVLNNYIIEI